MKLVFGVSDIPYAEHENTTGDVAEILERRYGIMSYFYEHHGDEIVGAVEQAMEAKLENILMGKQDTEPTALLSAGELSKLQDAFVKMLDTRQLDNNVPGVPTKASLLGINHRLTHPYRKSNPTRPSFIDTGQYSESMRVWTTE